MTLLATLEADASMLLSGAAKLLGSSSPSSATATTAASAVASAESLYKQAVADGEAAVETLVTNEATALLNDVLGKFGLGGLDATLDADAAAFLKQVLAEAAALLNSKIGAA